LVLLTLLVTTIMSLILLSSWQKPQTQSQLGLYQSDLLLQAMEWEALSAPAQPGQAQSGQTQSGQTQSGQTQSSSPSLRASFLGENPLQEAIKTYETVRTAAQKDLERPISPRRKDLDGTDPQPPSDKGTLVDELDLRLGLLYSQTQQEAKAQQTWEQLVRTPKAEASRQRQVPTAEVLLGLWSAPPRLLPDAELILQQNLKGWFRFQSLEKLYRLQQRQDEVVDLEILEQKVARSAFMRLLVVGALPVLGSIIGIGIALIWGIRRFLRRPTAPATMAQADTDDTRAYLPVAADLASSSASSDSSLASTVLWPEEIIWQVMVLWFSAFLGVSFLLPQLIAAASFHPETLSGRAQAYFELFTYICLMAVGFGILQWSLRPFIPSLLRWLRLRFSGNGWLWGIGGYFVALPLVLVVSLLNQKLLQDQGGGNPILEIILQGRDRFTIVLLWVLVAVCAPLFEETLFRGFFLTSLTRYLPMWQAIACSGLVFAIAHLNVGDLLPLTVLGMLLGFVYLRSRNLFASMLLHSLWNSGSFVGLLILGSSGS
jgi:hypothetical protein